MQSGNTRSAHTHARTHTQPETLHATLAMLLCGLVDTGGDVRTTKRFVVNTLVKGEGKVERL